MTLHDSDSRRSPIQAIKPNGGCSSGAVLGSQGCSCLLIAAAVALASFFAPGASRAGSVSEGKFAGLAARCAPTVAVQTLRAVALTESGLDPWALHDNTTSVSARPATFEAALLTAQSWLDRGDSIDIGLMQINSANLAALGMTAQTALDACVSLAGGAAVLQAAYGGGSTPADQQVALLLALSRYNTGSPLRGIMNGYARRVMASVEGGSASPMVVARGTPSPASDAVANPNAPPAWNVGAVGSYAQTHGAPWLVALAPEASSEQAVSAQSASPPVASTIVPATDASSASPAALRATAPARNPS
jgi:type IV secretion system protein VirB1